MSFMKFVPILLIALLQFCPGNLWAFGAAPEEADLPAGSCDQWFPATGKPKGVVVVTHGMNLKPSCMDDMAVVLAKAGYVTFRPAFEGHCGANRRYLDVSADKWEADARRVHAAAGLRAKELGVPLYLVAYSFTAPIFQSLQEELPFAKRVYLAPALATKFWYGGLVKMARWVPTFSFRSWNITECGANLRSGAGAILALEHFIGLWREGAGTKDQAPALILAEPDDELISAPGLEEIVKTRPHWKLEMLSNKGTTMDKTFHHLIVDEKSLGPAEWARVTGLVRQFLER